MKRDFGWPEIKRDFSTVYDKVVYHQRVLKSRPLLVVLKDHTHNYQVVLQGDYQ